MLSVIVPIYNVEKYLEQCLKSIIGQTYQDLEIILVNDGSSDGCSAIIDKYARADNRIRVVNKINGGLVSAYKAGYIVASGELVTFVDSDDWLELDMYQQMMDKHREYNCDMIIVAYDRVYVNGAAIQTPLGLEDGYYEHEQRRFFYLTGNRFISAARWNKIYCKELLDDIVMSAVEEVSYAEDLMITIPYALKTNSFYYIDKVLYHYRDNAESISNNIVKPNICSQIDRIRLQLIHFGVNIKYDVEMKRSIMDIYRRYFSLIKKANIARDKKVKLIKEMVNSVAYKAVYREYVIEGSGVKNAIIKIIYRYLPTYFYTRQIVK